MQLRFSTSVLSLSLSLMIALSNYSFAETIKSGQTLSGRIVRVADGDTVTLLTSSKDQVRIRLAEIDAPESGQPFGSASKKSLSRMCASSNATVRVQDIDRYGRVVGRVYCGGVDANAVQVQDGMAWVYDSYVRDKDLYRLQQSARESNLGLWTDPKPVKPWEWRRGSRGDAAGATDGNVQGNRNSKIYHIPGCPSYGSMSKKNVQEFSSESAAQGAGYRKAGNCR